MSIADDIKGNFKQGDMLTKLIFINVGIYLLVSIISMFGSFAGHNTEYFLIEYLAMPSGTVDLLYRIWTPITYMFLHTGFLHILFNMLWFYWMGKIFVDMLSGRRLLSVYLLGGLCGALLYILVYKLMQIPSHPILGASAAVMAVVIATATYFPNYTIYLFLFGPVKLKYLGVAAVVLDVITLDDGNFGGHIAHFGGEIFGFIWASQLKKGNDISKGFTVLVDKVLTAFKPKSKVKIHYRNNSPTSYSSYSQDAKKQNVPQADIDKILDKIANSGYNSLSKEEKEILFKMSNKK